MFFKTIDFSTYSSIKIGQPTKVLMIEKEDEIPSNHILIGGANNLLVSPNPPPLMMLSKDFATIEIEDNFLVIGAAIPTGRILSFAKKYNIGGFEFVAKLPGTLGGMLAMNAGVKSYEIFEILDSVMINGVWKKKSEIPHGYRFASLGGIATVARFEICSGFDPSLLESLKQLRANQPKEPSAGSAFKNPKADYAGRLIEAVGLRGVKKGGMQWSEVHANFLINLGNGKFEDAITLLELAKQKVKEEFDIELQEEIRRV